jgi:hypothetical protein
MTPPDSSDVMVTIPASFLRNCGCPVDRNTTIGECTDSRQCGCRAAPAASPVTTEQLDKLQFGKVLHDRPTASPQPLLADGGFQPYDDPINKDAVAAIQKQANKKLDKQDWTVIERIEGEPLLADGVRLPTKLTAEMACILEDCDAPEYQTPDAVAALIENYQPTWDRLCAALTPEHGVRERTTVSIKPMRLSDGRTDYFVSIRVGDREVTPHVFREEFKTAYHVALYDWLLNGNGEEPDVVDFSPDDWPARVAAQGER